MRIFKNIRTPILALLLFSHSSAAGIPTVDVVGNATAVLGNIQAAAEFAKEATRWVDTIANWEDQLKAFEDELLSKTGIRDAITTLKDFRQLYADFGRAYDNIESFNDVVLSDPKGFLKDKLNDTYKRYMIFDRCEWIQDSRAKNICLIDAITAAAEIHNANNKATQLNSIGKNLQDLEGKIRRSKDIKESQDLANAINLEIAKAQMTLAGLQTEHYRFEAEKKAQEERGQQLLEQGMTQGFIPQGF